MGVLRLLTILLGAVPVVLGGRFVLPGEHPNTDAQLCAPTPSDIAFDQVSIDVAVLDGEFPQFNYAVAGDLVGLFNPWNPAAPAIWAPMRIETFDEAPASDMLAGAPLFAGPRLPLHDLGSSNETTVPLQLQPGETGAFIQLPESIAPSEIPEVSPSVSVLLGAMILFLSRAIQTPRRSP